jgi:LuxR family maltose regulon positive regulatory protein
MLAAAAAQSRTGSVIEIGALRALALAACGNQDAAVDALARALALGYPQGYVRVFADEGAPMAALVRACGEADAAPPRSRAAAAPPGMAEPLTGRELEVLRLLAAGSSNQRIARELFVALDMVKKHVTHVLGKLGAANRTEAAARARQLGLIP